MQYNVYFAEDEYMLREHMKKHPLWQEGSYRLCGCASNGEDAWRDIQQMEIDILLTDIKMPFIDGLELARIVQANRPEIKIIILSGHDDFSYAKQALAIGVMDYLLKPLKSADVRKALDRAAEQIRQEREQKQSIRELENLAKESLSLNRHRFLSQLCSGVLPEDVIARKCEQLKLSFSCGAYCCCMVSIPALSGSETDSESYLSFVDCSQTVDAFAAAHENVYWYSDSAGEFRLLVGAAQNDAEDTAIRLLRELLQQLQQQCGSPDLLATVGTPSTDVSELYPSALSAQVTQSLVPRPKEPTVVPASSCRHSVSATQYARTEKELFLNLLSTGDARELPHFVSSMVEKIEAEQLSQLYMSYVCLDILSAINDFVKELGYSPEELPDLAIPNIIQLFDRNHDLSAFRAALLELAQSAIQLRDQRRGSRNSDIIQEAKAFLQNNYTDPSIDLTAVAKHINMNAAYFSALFKRETGQGFIDYLTYLRINRAKVLLKTTAKRTGDIAFEVGYSDQNYFSKLFKKRTGMSTREFRQNDQPIS